MSTTQFATAAFYVDLLAEQGTRLSEPYTRQLDGKLRELGGPPGWSGSAVTYWITSGRRIVLLTMFVQTRMRQTRDIDVGRLAHRWRDGSGRCRAPTEAVMCRLWPPQP
ncbi:MAG TPA: type II toxin-antitoxin system RelE/ParE family toxin [Pseudonocardiaceae bacterium]|nr:type II toxin-antitoxin system RelE/ParE family toxin [Pseudonocardiaceae bacterium]